MGGLERVAQERKNSRMEELSLQFTESGSKKIKTG